MAPRNGIFNLKKKRNDEPPNFFKKFTLFLYKVFLGIKTERNKKNPNVVL